MKPIVYPAVFHKEENAYLVEFPDLPGCITYGNDLLEAFLMAGDALKTWLCDPTDEYPAPTPLSEIKRQEGDLVQLIRPALYRTEYAKQYWIEEAIEKGLEERRLTQEQACIILGIEPTYLKDILSGTITPTHEMAERIALLLNFDPKIFFLDDEEE